MERTEEKKKNQKTRGRETVVKCRKVRKNISRGEKLGNGEEHRQTILSMYGRQEEIRDRENNCIFCQE